MHILKPDCLGLDPGTASWQLGDLGKFTKLLLQFSHLIIRLLIAVIEVCHPPTVQEGSFPFLHTLPSIYCRLVDDGHSDQCEEVSHHSFDLHFSNNEQC